VLRKRGYRMDFSLRSLLKVLASYRVDFNLRRFLKVTASTLKVMLKSA
jgi:hypothetical protein